MGRFIFVLIVVVGIIGYALLGAAIGSLDGTMSFSGLAIVLVLIAIVVIIGIFIRTFSND